MSNPAIETIKATQRCVQTSFRQETTGDAYLLSDENSGQQLEIALGGLSDSVCLVIDKKREKTKEGLASKDPTLPFIEPSEEGLTSKNDAIFMVSRDGVLFVFLVEMKLRSSGKYLLQMKTGKLITEFLLNLLKLHEKCDCPAPQFFGVLCYDGKKSVHKGTTRHDSSIEFAERQGLKVCDWSSPVLNAKDLVNAAKRCTP